MDKWNIAKCMIPEILDHNHFNQFDLILNRLHPKGKVNLGRQWKSKTHPKNRQDEPQICLDPFILNCTFGYYRGIIPESCMKIDDTFFMLILSGFTWSQWLQKTANPNFHNHDKGMRKNIIYLIILLFLPALPAWGENSMDYFNQGVKSTLTGTKIKYFSKALELDPYLSQAYEKRGMLYFFQEKFDKAIEDFQAFIRLEPQKAEAYRMLGRGYLKSGYRITSPGCRGFMPFATSRKTRRSRPAKSRIFWNTWANRMKIGRSNKPKKP